MSDSDGYGRWTNRDDFKVRYMEVAEHRMDDVYDSLFEEASA